MAKASAQITLHYVIDIQGMYRYYLLQSSTLAKPSKPNTYPPSSSWNDTEPSYTSGSTNSLYFVDCTVFCDGTFTYSDVSLSSSYEAAKAAYNKAVAAQGAADQAQSDINKLEIGGTNLLLNSKIMSDWVIESIDASLSDGIMQLNGVPSNFNSGVISIDNVEGVLTNGVLTISESSSELVNIDESGCGVVKTYSSITTSPRSLDLIYSRTLTLSFEIRSSEWQSIYNDNTTTPIVVAMNACVGSNANCARHRNIFTDYGANHIFTSDKWTKWSITFDVGDNVSWFDVIDQGGNPTLFSIVLSNPSPWATEIRKMKLEYGNKATDWSPAPEDVQEGIGTAIDNLEIGGRNLLPDSEKNLTTTRFMNIVVYDILAPYIGRTITVSFDAKINEGGISRPIQVYAYQGNGITISSNYYFTPTSEYKRYSFTTTVVEKINPANDGTYSKGEIAFYDGEGLNNYTLRKVQIELGNKATDWTPALEDMANKNDVNNAIDSIEIGGRNILLDTSDVWTEVSVQSWSGALWFAVNGIKDYQHHYSHYGVKSGDYMTFSADLKAVNKNIFVRVDAVGENSQKGYTGNVIQKGTTGRSAVTIQVSDEYPTIRTFIGSDGTDSTATIEYYKCYKIEKGNKATDWSPAVEDMANKNDVSDAINSVEIGGRNLIQKSDLTSSGCHISVASTNNIEVTNVVSDGTSIIYIDREFAPGTYTINATNNVSDKRLRLISTDNVDGSFTYNTYYNSVGYPYFKDITLPVTYEFTSATKMALMVNYNSSKPVNNLADPSSPDWLMNSGMDSLDGSIVESEGRIITNYIPVTATSKIHIRGLQFGVNATPIFAHYTEDKSYNTGWGSSYHASYYDGGYYQVADYDSSVGIYDFSFVNSSNVKYIRVIGYPTGDISDVAISVDERFIYGSIISGLKLETGNKATDWSPAPEDVQEGIDTTQTSVSDAMVSIDANATRIEYLDGLVQVIQGALSTLVTDDNGTTLLQQTGSGWSFNFSDINNALNKYDSYIRLDESNNQPCIILGKPSNNFKVKITNTDIEFIDGSDMPAAQITSNDDTGESMLDIENAKVNGGLRQDDWEWRVRSNGNYGLSWKG